MNKVAICVGHSRQVLGKTEGGAVSVGNVSEHDFNSEVAGHLQEQLKALGITSQVFDQYGGSGYSAAMLWVSEKVKQYGANLAIELHFNCSDTEQSNGFEYLFWKSSLNGKRLASLLLSEQGIQFPELKKRGLVPCTNSDRGAAFLKFTLCPAVICEPFFGSNKHEWSLFSKNPANIAKVYATAIQKYFA